MWKTGSAKGRRIGLGVALVLGLVAVPLSVVTTVSTAASAAPGTASSPVTSDGVTASAEAPDGLFPIATDTGKVYMSETGIGTNDPTGGPVYVQKDSANSTVRAAYLLAAGIPGYTMESGTVTLNGVSLSFTPADSVEGNFGVNSVWTNVTTIVAPVVDAAPTGLVKFNAAEPLNTDTVTGEILAVVMNDPTLPTSNTVSFLFGALDTAGDSFNIGLASPLNLSAPTLSMTMSIGDSYGYQGPPGDGQYSTIEVDGTSMTSAAGGNDDSACKYDTPQNFTTCGNGELITVGGIGDTPETPSDPTATTYTCVPGPPRCTDELYNLLPFVHNGDTSIQVNTTNPSDNDNIFFTGFQLNSATAVVGEGAVLSPATGSSPVGSPYTFTTKVQNTAGDPIADQPVTFTVLSGPDAGKTATATTNASGVATFVDTSAATGTDTVQVSFTNATGGTETSNGATVVWTAAASVPTTLSTSLSGGGKTGTAISVPASTAVTDTATLGGATATAGGTVTYSVYSNAACTTSAGSGGTVDVTNGTVPASSAVTLSTAGTYYWKASYSGDSANGLSTSTCGTAGEVETVTPVIVPTTLSTSLSGGGKTGTAISVPASTAVTDTATLGGATATAAGTVTYSVYSNAACTTSAGSGGTVDVTNGTVPASSAVTLSTAGTYYWKASYSGDSANGLSTSTCGTAGEVETVTPVTTPPPPSAKPTKISTSLTGRGVFGGHLCWWPGDQVTVYSGAAVTDSAKLSGTNVATAGGTVTYTVYSSSNPQRAHVVANAGTVTVKHGIVPDSEPVTLAAGTYYWQASYSGDAANQPSVSVLGSEVETVVPVPHCGFGWFGGLDGGCCFRF